MIPNSGIRDFRDPKVFWRKENEEWIMILAAAYKVMLYSFPNLIDWEHESDFGQEARSHEGIWECPDLFKLKVEGSDKEKWVTIVSIGSGGPNGGSATQYFVGDFYGKSFEPTNDINLPIWLDYGRDNHTGVTWLDIPEEDGQKIFIGWMSDWQYAQIVPTKAWRSAMTIPRTLHLTKNKGAYTLASRPVEEIKNIDSEDVRQSYSFTVENNLSEPVSYQMIAKRKDVLSFEVLQKTEVEFDLKDIEGKTFGIELSNQVNDRYIFSIKDGLVQSERTCIGDQSFST